jgi:hypothetical protein
MRAVLKFSALKEAIRGPRLDTAIDLIAKAVLVLGFLFMACAGAKGSIYSIVPGTGDLKDLKQNVNYTWGIDRPWSASEEAVSATLSFSQIYNKDKSPNVLYIYLLDKTKEGVNSGKDSKDGDYFGTMETVTYIKLSDQAQDLSYCLTPEQLKILNTYAFDNTFGLGFDPGSHFYNSGVKLEIVTGSPAVACSSVPEPQTLVLLALGSVVWIKRYVQNQKRNSVGR